MQNRNSQNANPPLVRAPPNYINAVNPIRYFANVFLLAPEATVRYKFLRWIRLFAYYGGIILTHEDQRLATHVLHVRDEESFEDVKKYYDVKHALHINVEWIKDTIQKGYRQDERPYRVTLLPGRTLYSS